MRDREVGRWKSEDGSQKLEDGRWMSEVGSWKLGVGKLSLFLFMAIIGILSACSSGEKSDNENVQSRLSTKDLKYFAVGQQLYTRYCINCHMENGEGLGTLIPPLKNSDYLLNDVLAAARTIKYGLKGPITVNGIAFNQPMPANPNLTSFEIQELLVYISNAWGNESEVISGSQVEDFLQSK